MGKIEPLLLDSWKMGIEYFNSGSYWHAHEAWERGWLKLPPNEKIHIQILIQTAGVFYLIEKKRWRGARSLLETALAKFERLEASGGIAETYPRIDVPGLEEALMLCLRDWPDLALERVQKSLKARLLVSPG